LINLVPDQNNRKKTQDPTTDQTLIALYCGSRAGHSPIYKESAIQLAQFIAEQDHATQEGFLPPQHRAKLMVCENLGQIFEIIQHVERQPPEKVLF